MSFRDPLSEQGLSLPQIKSALTDGAVLSLSQIWSGWQSAENRTILRWMWDLFRLIFGLIIDLFRSRAALEAEALVPVANLSGWQLIENQAILLWDDGSLQAYWLDGCRSAPVAGNA
jgi:hypothetical protein